ncbi:MAG: hypothetical protein FWE82_06135 [Defluviitaleaceae bacterium]|nr:hypothetical protein [Defluviitaleaceae bacterium]
MMFGNIEFNKSAFKHGISESDIYWAFIHSCYDGPIEDMENKFLRLGFDKSGNLLEIMYNEIDENNINVFYAMKCRKIYYKLITGGN